MKRGLYLEPKFSVTAKAAAWASSLFEPTIKFSKV